MTKPSPKKQCLMCLRDLLSDGTCWWCDAECYNCFHSRAEHVRLVGVEETEIYICPTSVFEEEK